MRQFPPENQTQCVRARNTGTLAQLPNYNLPLALTIRGCYILSLTLSQRFHWAAHCRGLPRSP